MGEWVDDWAARRMKNLCGTVPSVVDLQREGGAAGTIYGAPQNGLFSTTFTAAAGSGKLRLSCSNESVEMVLGFAGISSGNFSAF